jgi:hypothetical protein
LFHPNYKKDRSRKDAVSGSNIEYKGTTATTSQAKGKTYTPNVICFPLSLHQHVEQLHFNILWQSGRADQASENLIMSSKERTAEGKTSIATQAET